MTTIQLSQGRFATIDDEDAITVEHYKWHYSAGYALRTLYKSARSKQFLHNFLMNPPKGLEVDHIDGNPLNNQRSNLRVCSHAQNMRNRLLAKHNTSGFKGVSLHRKTNKWQATIALGLYETKEEAAMAFDKAAHLFFGEFASLNFPHKTIKNYHWLAEGTLTHEIST